MNGSGNTGRTRACHRRAYSNLDAGQQSGAVGAAAAPGLRSAGRSLLKPELTTSQVRAIEILLRKSIPDLAAAKIKSEQTHRYVVEMPPVLDGDEWQRKYGQNPSLIWLPARALIPMMSGKKSRLVSLSTG